MKSIYALLFLILLFIGCNDDEEKQGICTALVDENSISIEDCIGPFTKAQCTQYDNDRVDGHRWKFVDVTTSCPAILPKRD